jgi:hypothetical protein
LITRGILEFEGRKQVTDSDSGKYTYQ